MIHDKEQDHWCPNCGEGEIDSWTEDGPILFCLEHGKHQHDHNDDDFCWCEK